MRFRNDDFPRRSGNSNRKDSELAAAVAEEHPKHIIAVAEQQIMATHHHSDGSPVELHQVGSQEFIQHSMQGSLEGKLTGNFESSSNDEKQMLQQQSAVKIEYEKKSFQQPQQVYGSQQTVTGGGTAHRQETAMMGCSCGTEWTVTGQSTKAQGAESVKIEQYGPGGAGGAAQPGGYRASGAGGEKTEYRTSAGQHQDYKG